MIIHRKTFYLLRHGQSTDNAAGLVSGAGSDPCLTELGRKQAVTARKVLDRLKPVPAKIIVSGLRRTHETAELAFGHQNYHIDPQFNERHLGELDGKITEEQQRQTGCLPGEETSLDHGVRVIEAMNRYLALHDDMLIISHGGTIRRILEALGLKDKIIVENGIVYRISPQIDRDQAWDILSLT